jgi:parvulin-like peptidyl-prolyl isomerase
MTDEPTERLKQFRAANARRQAPRTPLLLTLVILCGFTALIALQLFLHTRAQAPSRIAESGGGLTTGQLREYAVYLEEKQLPGAAIEAYEAYLGKAQIEEEARARICYSIAKLAIDAEQYELALAYLYQAEMLQPDSDLKDEINKRVVHCLEKLDRSVDLRKELRRRTDLKRTPDDLQDGETVLAEFAGEIITDRDLEMEIESLPPYAREAVDTPEKRADLLKNMVAERLLLDKALRLELDKDPEVQERLAEERDAMIVRKLIADEVQQKVRITPEDVERFYKAEPARFTEPATAEVLVGKAESEDAAKALTEFPEKAMTLRKGMPARNLPLTPEAEDAIFAAEPESTTEPVQLGEVWYVFKLVSKHPEKLLPFDQVKEQATRALQLQKEQEQVRALIEETLQARDVRLHLDKLKQKAQTQ